MADVYNKLDGTALDATDDADKITEHMIACGHAVLQIDGIKAGTDIYKTPDYSQAVINDCVERSVGHLKLMVEESWWKADSVSRSGNAAKAKHTAAIKTGEDYIAANS
jgi:hypothetical protein